MFDLVMKLINSTTELFNISAPVVMKNFLRLRQTASNNFNAESRDETGKSFQ